MPIVADFLYCISSGTPGNPPFTVEFSDTSTGIPDSWFWDFGDGETSDEQSPTHIYTEVGNPTVKLKAWWSSGAVTVVPTLAREWRQGSGSSRDAAYAAWLANSWDSGGSTGLYWYYEQVSGSVYGFAARRANHTWDLTSHGGAAFASITTGRLNGPNVVESELIVTDFGNTAAPVQVDVPFIDVTSLLGTSFSSMVEDANDYDKLLLGVLGQVVGWRVDVVASPPKPYLPIVVDYTTDIDEVTKQIFELSASFSASPRSGTNPLTANFTYGDLGAPSIYSWRLRVSGSGAPFTEFSNVKNPVKGFDKTSP